MMNKVVKCLILLLVIPGMLFVFACHNREPAPPTDTTVVTPVPPKTDVKPVPPAKTDMGPSEEEIKAQQREMENKRQREKFMNEDVYFDYDSSTLLPMAERILRDKADFLRNNPSVTVIIEGHCDERGSNEYNLALGDRRAESAKAYLVNLGIQTSRLSTISYGEERPVDDGHNEEAWAKNRRAHFVIE